MLESHAHALGCNVKSQDRKQERVATSRSAFNFVFRGHGGKVSWNQTASSPSFVQMANFGRLTSNAEEHLRRMLFPAKEPKTYWIEIQFRFQRTSYFCFVCFSFSAQDTFKPDGFWYPALNLTPFKCAVLVRFNGSRKLPTTVKSNTELLIIFPQKFY